MIQKILVPTDLSSLGDYAYQMAHRIAKSTGAEIVLLNVMALPSGAVLDREGKIKDDDEMDHSSFFAEEAEISTNLKEYIKDKPDIATTKVVIGSVNEEILKYMKGQDIDLVIMGTHGASGLSEKIIGSHADKIIRKASVPVITLKCDRSDYDINDILFASDFESKEPTNLEPVLTIAKAFNADIHLLKINTPKNFKPNRAIKEKMIEFADENHLEAKEIKMHIYCDESVEQGILNFSAESGVDFVALATSRKKGLARLFHENISVDVVNHNFQPVMTFPIQ